LRSSGCGEVSGSEERREEGCYRMRADDLVVAAAAVPVTEEKVEESEEEHQQQQPPQHEEAVSIRYSGVCGCACFGCCSLISSFGWILRFSLGFLGQKNVMIQEDASSTF